MSDPTSYMTQQLLPNDRDAERNVIGTIVANDGLFDTVSDVLNSDAFYDERLKSVFRCVKYLLVNKKIADERSILETANRFRGKMSVEITDIDILDALSRNEPQSFVQDVERIVEYGVRRKAWKTLIESSRKVLALADNEGDTISDTIKELDAIRNSAVSDSGIVDADKAIRMIYKQVGDNLAGINKDSILTGYRFSDEKGGLRCGSLVVVGAFTSVGKSCLAMNIAVNVARNNIPVAYYSLEMSVVELWARIINQHTCVPAWKITSYALNENERRDVDGCMDDLRKLPIYIDDNATTKFEKMIRSVRTMVKKYGIKMFVVDYLQIFAQNTRGEKEESAISYMARECKNICRELNIVCILLSQLRRAGDDKHPSIDMLRGSGQIEESADNIILIDRPDAHLEWGVTKFKGNNEMDVHGKAELRVSKGRNIGTGVYYVDFDEKRLVFKEPDGCVYGETLAEENKSEDMPF